MAIVHVSLFGKIDVRVEAAPGVSFADSLSVNAQKLLSYLLLHRSRSHARERLGGLLWQHGSTTRTKAYLRKAIWQIQHVFERESSETLCDEQPINGKETDSRVRWAESVHLLDVDGDWVQLSPGVDLSLDVETLETAFASVQNQHGSKIDEAQARRLEQAVRLYTGDLLENWYADWCLLERERLQDMYLMALKKLMWYAERAQRYEDGIAWGMQMLGVDPARECAHRQLMRLRYLADDRTGALRQYARCAEVLDEELGVEPADATRRLHTEIRNDALTPRPATASRRDERRRGRLAAPAASFHRLQAPDVLGQAPVEQEATTNMGGAEHEGIQRIRQMQRTLAGLQSQIQKELRAMDAAQYDEESSERGV